MKFNKLSLLILLTGVSSVSVWANDSSQSISQIREAIIKELSITNQEHKPSLIIGEQLDFPLPKGVEMAYLGGKPDTVFLAEYIEKQDDIEKWSGYFAAQNRSKIPLQLLADLTASGIHQACSDLIVDVSLLKLNQTTLEQEYNDSTYMYFCNDKNQVAPYGEGGFIKYFAGEDYQFKFWIGWRPNKAFSNPHEIIAELDKLMPESIKICNPNAGKPCLHQGKRNK